MISCDVTTTSMQFLHANFVAVAFSGYLHFYFCNLYWKCECPGFACNNTIIYLYHGQARTPTFEMEGAKF